MAHSGPFETSPISRPATNPDPLDELPAHSLEAERAVLGCVLLTNSTAEADALLLQLRTPFFYDLRHQVFFQELVQLRMENHAIDLVVIINWLKGRNKMYDIGGDVYLATLPDCTPSIAAFSSYLGILKEKHIRRQCLQMGERAKSLAGDPELTLAQLKEVFADMLEATEKGGDSARPLIELWSLADAKAYKADPKTFLIGAGMLAMGELAVIAGPPSCGKSLLANSLAVAGARGTGLWMGYEVKRRFKTLILQSEASPHRLQKDLEHVPDQLADSIRVSLPCFMQFDNPAFRSELRRIHAKWPFDLIIIDNLTDVLKAEAREDVIDALANINASLPGFPQRPAVLILAHLRKARGGEKWVPKSGRALQAEQSGSFVLAAKARTMWFLQPGANDLQDPRVVFDCGKCNNDVPLPRSAWTRNPVEFTPLPNFDFDEWEQAGENTKDEGVTETDLRNIFREHGPSISRPDLRKILAARGVARSSLYRIADPDDPTNKFRGLIWTVPETGKLAWK